MGNLRGAILMMLAMLGFGLEDMFTKLMGQRLHVGMIITSLGIGGALVFGIWARARGHRLLGPEVLCRPVLLRGLGEVLGAVCFMSALVLAPMAQTLAIIQATPLAVTLGAALFLGEQVGWRRWSAILIGFLGVLVVIRPFGQDFSLVLILPLISALALAMRDLATLRVPRAISSLQLACYGFAVTVPAGIALMLLSPEAQVLPDGRELAWAFGALVCGVSGYYALVEATRIGEVSAVVPFRYTRLLVAIVLGALVFGERPDPATLLGSALIVGSGLYALWRERRLARRRARPRPASPASGRS